MKWIASDSSGFNHSSRHYHFYYRMEWDYEPGEILDSGDEEIRSQCNDYTTGRCYIARDVSQTPLQNDQSLGFKGHRAFAIQQLPEYPNIWDTDKVLCDPSTFLPRLFWRSPG